MFNEKGYQPVKELINSDLAETATQYALINELDNFCSEGNNAQVRGAHSRYADPLMETLLLRLKEKIEYVTEKNLIPTYSYYRVYRKGHELLPHKDRPACEISVTLTLGFNYLQEHAWPMYIENTPIICEPGDGIIYKGCEVEHWRTPFECDDNTYHVQTFLHYVDANGPHADQALDQRLYIGQTPAKQKPYHDKSYIISTK